MSRDDERSRLLPKVEKEAPLDKTDGSTDDLLSRDDEQSRLLPEVEKEASLDIKLNCKEYKQGNVYIDTDSGYKIYIPTTTTVEKNHNTYTYSNVLPKLTTSKQVVYNFAQCENVNIRGSGRRINLTEHLYFSRLSIGDKKINGHISLYTKNTGKKLFIILGH